MLYVVVCVAAVDCVAVVVTINVGNDVGNIDVVASIICFNYVIVMIIDDTNNVGVVVCVDSVTVGTGSVDVIIM